MLLSLHCSAEERNLPSNRVALWLTIDGSPELIEVLVGTNSSGELLNRINGMLIKERELRRTGLIKDALVVDVLIEGQSFRALREEVLHEEVRSAVKVAIETGRSQFIFVYSIPETRIAEKMLNAERRTLQAMGSTAEFTFSPPQDTASGYKKRIEVRRVKEAAPLLAVEEVKEEKEVHRTQRRARPREERPPRISEPDPKAILMMLSPDRWRRLSVFSAALAKSKEAKGDLNPEEVFVAAITHVQHAESAVEIIDALAEAIPYEKEVDPSYWQMLMEETGRTLAAIMPDEDILRELGHVFDEPREGPAAKQPAAESEASVAMPLEHTPSRESATVILFRQIRERTKDLTIQEAGAVAVVLTRTHLEPSEENIIEIYGLLSAGLNRDLLAAAIRDLSSQGLDWHGISKEEIEERWGSPSNAIWPLLLAGLAFTIAKGLYFTDLLGAIVSIAFFAAAGFFLFKGLYIYYAMIKTHGLRGPPLEKLRRILRYLFMPIAAKDGYIDPAFSKLPAILKFTTLNFHEPAHQEGLGEIGANLAELEGAARWVFSRNKTDYSQGEYYKEYSAFINLGKGAGEMLGVLP